MVGQGNKVIDLVVHLHCREYDFKVVKHPASGCYEMEG